MGPTILPHDRALLGGEWVHLISLPYWRYHYWLSLMTCQMCIGLESWEAHEFNHHSFSFHVQDKHTLCRVHQKSSVILMSFEAWEDHQAWKKDIQKVIKTDLSKKKVTENVHINIWTVVAAASLASELLFVLP